MTVTQTELDFLEWMSSFCGRKVSLREHNRHVLEEDTGRQALFQAVQDGSYQPSPEIVSELQHHLAPALISGRPLIYATMHWGDYVGSFLDIAACHPVPTSFATIRGWGWQGLDEEAFWESAAKITGHAIEVFRIEQRRTTAILRKLAGGAKLFMMFDLDGRYGQTSAVKLFDASLHMTSGWARLAYAADAPVVFIRPRSQGEPHTQIVSVAEPRQYITSVAFVGDALNMAQQCLAGALQINPSLWFRWSDLQHYTIGES